MQEGNQSHSNIGKDSPINQNPNGQVSNGNSAPFMGDPNKLGSLNITDDKVASNVSDKPISEMSNLNYTNATKSNASKTPKGTGLGKYLAMAVISLILLSGAGFGAYKLVSSSNKQKTSSIASSAVSKTISLNVPVGNNQQSLSPAQTAGQSINLNGDVAIQGSLNTTGAIKSSDNISGQNLNIQGNITTGGSITGSTFNGNGSGLTALNANNITSGTLNPAQLPSNVTQLGQSIPLSAIQANIVSSINGIVNNGGNISVVGSGNVSVSNNQATNTITISSTSGGTITGVTVGSGLTGGGTTGNVAIGLDGSVTLQGNAFNGANELVQLNSSSQLPVLDASNLTNLNATNISSGTVDNARLTGDVTLQGNTFNGASQLVQLGNDGKLTALDGSNLTNLNGANLQTGSVPDSALSSNVCLGSSNNCNYQTAGNYINLQSGTPGTPQTGNINVSGSVIAGSFIGNGSQLTNINGSSISGGTVSSNYLPNTITYQGNTFNGNNELVQTNASGTINDSLLTTNVCLGASNNCNYQTAGNYVSIQGATPGTPQTGNINISGTNIAAYFSGDGHLLSNINASNVTTGTINNLRLSNDVTLQGNTFNGASQLIQTTAIGYIPALNGSLITNLNASSINQGTLSDSRLSSNIPLKNASNTFIQNNTFSGGITTDSIQPSSSLTVGSTSKSLTLQGSSTTISSTNSGGTTTIGFNGTSSGSVNYRFDAATTPGTYFVCTTVGNCGTGSSLSGSGTTGSIALFNGTQNLGNSKISQTGSNVSVAGNLSVAPTVNSTSTFVIQNASANPLFSADTTNGRIGIGNSSPNYPLDVTGNINSSTGLYVNGTKVCDSTGCGSSGGSGFYIQNGTSNQTNANFNIQSSSSSSVVGILKGASGQSADLLDLQNSSGTNKVAFSAGGNVNIAGAYQINGSQINSSNLSDSSNIGLLNGNQTYTGNNTISGNTILSGNSTFTGTVLQQNSTDSTTAFQIQNAAGTDNLFVADTTNSRIGIGTNTPGYTLDVNGDVNIADGSHYLVGGTPICSGSNLCAPSAGSNYYVQNSTTQQADTNINIKSTSASSVTATLSGTSGQSADILDLVNSDGNFISRSAQFGSAAVTLLGQSDNLTGTLGLQSASTTNNIFFQPTSIDGGLSNAIITVPDENGQICTTAGSAACTAVYAAASGSGAYINLQSDIPGTVQTGNLNISGVATAGLFSGNGGLITNLNGNEIKYGTVASTYLPNNITYQGNSFNGVSQLVQTNGSGNISISGSIGTASALFSPSLDTASAGALSIGTTNATSITLGKASQGQVSIPGGITTNGNPISTAGGGISTSNGSLNLGTGTITTSGAIQGGAISGTTGNFSSTVGVSGVLTASGGINTSNANVNFGTGTITSGAINGATISGGTLSNTGVGGSGAFTVSSGGSSALTLSSGSGNVSTGSSTINGQTISSAANFTGTLGVSGAVTAASFSGIGSSLTSLNGSNISSGTVADSRLTSNVCLSSTNNCGYQAAGSYITLQGSSPVAQTGNISVTGSIAAGTFSGNGASITSLNGGNIQGGTVTNTALQNSSITINNGTNVTGGGTVSLGGTLTVDIVSNPTFSTSVTTPSLTSTGALAITSANTYALSLNGVSISNSSAITGVSSLNSTGSITGVGLSAGTGSITGTGGATITGTTNINTSGSSSTNIGTGSNTGTTTIGNLSDGSTVLQGSIGVNGTATFGSTSSLVLGTGSGVSYASSSTANFDLSNSSGSFSSTKGLVTLQGSTNTINGTTNINTANSISTGVNIGTGSTYTGTISIANGTGASTVNIGNSSSTLSLQGSIGINGTTKINSANTSSTVIGNNTGFVGIGTGATTLSKLLSVGSAAQLTIDNSGNLTTSGTVTTSAGGATGVGSQTLASNLYIQSRGTNLVTNGTGLLGNNYNFSNFTFDSVNVYSGAGSFKNSTFNAVVQNDELIPVDPSQTYQENLWAESTTYDANSRAYFGISPYDIDGNVIYPQDYSKVPGSTDTTLAQALNPGDTTITLTNATGWNNTLTASQYNYISWYGYTNSKGYTYPNYTYTKNNSHYYGYSAGTWPIGGISGNTITLSAPWSGPALAAGAAVRNSYTGGTYKYIAAVNLNVPATWTQYTGRIGGIDVNGAQITNMFPYGTAYVKLLFLLNRDIAGNNTNITGLNSVTNISDLSFSNNSGQFTSLSATNIPLIVQGASSQTASLLQIQNSSGTTLTSFDASGNLINAATGTSSFAGSLSVSGSSTLTGNTSISAGSSLSNFVNIGTGTSYTGTVSIATGTGASTVNIGNSSSGVNLLGLTSINKQGSANTNIGTGTNTGITTIGNLSGGSTVIQGSIGINGTTNINASVNSNTNINTGTSTGQVNIGNSSTAANAVNITSGSTGGITLNGGSSTSTLILQGSTASLNSNQICSALATTCSSTYAQLATGTNTFGSANTFNNSVTIAGTTAINTSNTSSTVIGNNTGFVGIGTGATTLSKLLSVGSAAQLTIDNSGNLNTTGSITGVGINSGTGQIQGSGGLSVSGAITNINASSNFNTNINTGNSTGLVSIGNSSNTNNSVTITGGSTGGINLNGYTNINSGTGTTANTTNINSGSTTSSSTTNIGTSYNGSNGGTVNIGNAKGSVAISGTITSSVTLQVGSGGSGGSTTAFLINNASGSQLLAADSINGQIIIGSSSNGVALSGSGLTLSGTAQRLRTITLTPEYSGAVLDSGNQANDIGTMTAGFDSSQNNISSGSGYGENYYQWTTSQGSSQTYDVVVRVPIPTDWSSWNNNGTVSPIAIDTKSSNTTGAAVTAFLYDTGGTVENLWNSCSITVAATWVKNPGCAVSGTYSANGVLTLKIRLASTGNNTQLGNIYLTYNSKW